MSHRLARAGFVAAKFLVALLALGYVALLGVLYVAQEHLIFRGIPLPADHRFYFDTRFEEVRIPVSGASLDALHFRQPDPRGLVFYLHGNAGNLETWTTGLDFYRQVNYDLFIFDYRGYGKSTGRIGSEDELNADVRAAWDSIAPAYRGKPIVVFGRSLGTGLAARLARDVDPALLVLVTPYTSLAAAAKRAYPLTPEWLLRYPLRTDALIGDVRSPMLLLHGAQDTLIPLADSERLVTLTRSPAELVVVPGAGHNDMHRFASYLDALAERLLRAGGR
ncbi:MAG: alpha/beta fold hydrolase [Betaproteobacteria bacterium]